MDGSFGRSNVNGAHRNTITNRQQSERIVAAFNTWAYKREQPSNISRLYATAEASAANQQPVQFVLYWGKGPRRHAAGPEQDCLNYLQSMLDRIARAYAPGADLELLLTDSHARLNNHPQAAIDQYFASVRQEASMRGISTRLLSSLAIDHPVLVNDCADTCPSEQTLNALVASAAKWYGGHGSPRSGALAYYAMNMRERVVVGKFYPAAIFITFNGSDLSPLFPEALPIFYMYSVRKGCAVKPWFMPAPEDNTTLSDYMREPLATRTLTLRGNQ